MDIRRNELGVFEQTVGTLEVTQHHILKLPYFEVGGHETLPCCVVVASRQRRDGLDGTVGLVVN